MAGGAHRLRRDQDRCRSRGRDSRTRTLGKRATMKWIKSVLRTAMLPVAMFSALAPAQEGRGDVVYVPTPQVVVDEMLTLAKIGPKDFLIDLGSGDGRIVITAAKKYGSQGFGVDLDRYLLGLAREGAKKEGVADK